MKFLHIFIPKYIITFFFKYMFIILHNSDSMPNDLWHCLIFCFLHQGLKENWAKMQKGYLLLPMLTDTIPKVLKKKKLENQLRELEKDILLVETNPYIYIYE